MDRASLRVDTVRRPARSLFVLPQVGLSFSSRLLDRSSMMVLVARQSCAARKCLLAIRIWTLVWPFARMDSTVSCERRRVAKGLKCITLDNGI